MIATEEIVSNQPVESAPVSQGSGVHYCEHCGLPTIAAPTLQNAEDGSLLQLRCFVRRGSPNYYIAECIDLDISSEAETPEAAIAGLQDAMKGYLLVVLDGLGTDEAPSVLRPSPLSHRIRYSFECMKYKVVELIFRTHGRTEEKFYQVSSGMIRSHCGI